MLKIFNFGKSNNENYKKWLMYVIAGFLFIMYFSIAIYGIHFYRSSKFILFLFAVIVIYIVIGKFLFQSKWFASYFTQPLVEPEVGCSNSRIATPNPMSIAKTKKTALILTMTIILLTLFAFSFCTQKEGYHGDEIASYGLANSEFMPFFPRDIPTKLDIRKNFIEQEILSPSILQTLKNYIEKGVPNLPGEEVGYTWFEQDFIRDFLTVNEHDYSHYLSVYYNQSKDVHPPLFYWILHTFSRFVPNTFSKYIGLSVNLICYVGTCILLFFVAYRIFKNEIMAILSMIAWGVSPGAISSVLFIRMYCMLGFFTLLTILAHLKCLEKEEFNFNSACMIVIPIILGFLTQYYFCIFAFFLAVIYFIIKLTYKHIFHAFKYMFALIFAAGFGLALFPPAWRHIFKQYRGQQAFENIVNAKERIDSLVGYVKIISQDVLLNSKGEGVWLLCIVFIIVPLSLVVLQIIKLIKGEKDFSILIFLCPVIFSLPIIVIISPFLTRRYIMWMYPEIVLSLIYFIYNIFKLFRKNEKSTAIYFCGFLSVLFMLGIHVFSPMELHKGTNKQMEIAQQYQGRSCIYFVKSGSWGIYDLLPQFLNFERVMFLNSENLNAISEDFIIKNSDELILYIASDQQIEKILNLFKAETHLENYEELYSENFKIVRVFHRN